MELAWQQHGEEIRERRIHWERSATLETENTMLCCGYCDEFSCNMKSDRMQYGANKADRVTNDMKIEYISLCML